MGVLRADRHDQAAAEAEAANKSGWEKHAASIEKMGGIVPAAPAKQQQI
jgi:hypothetical protein